MLACFECVGAKLRTPMCGNNCHNYDKFYTSPTNFFSGDGSTAREEDLGTRLIPANSLQHRNWTGLVLTELFNHKSHFLV